MNCVILSKICKEPLFCDKEILRYAGCKEADNNIIELLRTCICESRDKFIYRVCYSEFPVTIDGDICDFEVFCLKSQKLALNLKGCEKAIVFAATVGLEIDRLIAKYGHISPAKALMFQAIGTERIEALCDAFSADIAKEYNSGVNPRFSPGYSDLPLIAQKSIFSVLSPEKHIGLTLTDSLLMSPSKSVTAVMGIGSDGKQIKNKCSMCNFENCAFRGVI